MYKFNNKKKEGTGFIYRFSIEYFIRYIYIKAHKIMSSIFNHFHTWMIYKLYRCIISISNNQNSLYYFLFYFFKL